MRSYYSVNNTVVLTNSTRTLIQKIKNTRFDITPQSVFSVLSWVITNTKQPANNHRNDIQFESELTDESCLCARCNVIAVEGKCHSNTFII